jgi:Uri superfamily endonuclease
MVRLVDLPTQAGNYVIVGYSANQFAIEIKRFGLRKMPPGYYLYCGSAHGPGGLAGRVNRHLDPHTKKFWHFDYLKHHVKVAQVWWQVNASNFECDTAQFLLTLPGANCVIKGFGASDCRKGCTSHLIHYPDLVKVEQGWQKVDQKGWDYHQIILGEH